MLIVTNGDENTSTALANLQNHREFCRQKMRQNIRWDVSFIPPTVGNITETEY